MKLNSAAICRECSQLVWTIQLKLLTQNQFTGNDILSTGFVELILK